MLGKKQLSNIFFFNAQDIIISYFAIAQLIPYHTQSQNIEVINLL